MDVATTCPACGAVLSAPADARQITCSFCGNRFDLDMSGVSPLLRVASSSREMPNAPEPVEVFNSPTVEVLPPEKEYLPPPTTPVSPTVTSSRIPFLSGRPVWIIITIAVALLLCVGFACVASIFWVFRVMVTGQ